MPALIERLGLPGIADVHVHFMPANVLAKVWAYFDRSGDLLGNRAWPITYREDEAQRLAHLRELGVRAFPSLVYPHKPGMAAWLTDWALGFAARTPGCTPTGTFFPEPGAAGQVAAGLAAGVRLWKAHVQVGDYDPRDPLLDPVWGLLAEAGTPVVVHCGSGPAPGRFTGPEPFEQVLARHPTLFAVVAHAGLPDYAAFLALADRYPRVALDTTMVWTGFTEDTAPFPSDLLPAVRDLGLAGKVLFGSDYPNIPHSYAHQLDVLTGLDLGDDWLREVLWHAPLRALADGAAGVGTSTRLGALGPVHDATPAPPRG